MAGSGLPRISVEALKSALAGPFDLDVDPGQCAVITGASGSGKSLFLRMVADLDANEGQVRLDGRERVAFPPPEWRRSVCYVAAEAGWWHQDVAAHFEGGQRAPARDWADRLGLAADLIKAQVARLSTGEKQRLALIRALLLNPPVLLLDEPTGALDQASAKLVEAAIRDRMTAGAAVILVTHDEALGERLGDLRYRMSERRLTPA